MNKWMLLSLASLTLTGALNPVIASTTTPNKTDNDNVRSELNKKIEATSIIEASTKLKDRGF